MDTRNPFSNFEELPKLPAEIGNSQNPETMKLSDIAGETGQLAGNIVAIRARAAGYPAERKAA